MKAFAELYQRLVRQTAVLLGSQEDAEDVLQDSFCKLWSKPPVANDEDAQRILKATIHNLAVDELRKRGKRRTVPLDPNLYRIQAAEDDAGERERQFEVVDRAIEEMLTPVQRQIIQLREYEDCKYSDIAQQLGMSETAVRMQISRARQKIRAFYNENYRL